MNTRYLAGLTAGVGLLMSAPAATAPADWHGRADAKGTHVQILAINDFHGHLEPPTGSGGRVAVGPGRTVDAGGAEYLATHLKRLEREAPRSYVVAAGDLVGASPLLSGLFHDEPAVESLGLMGLDYAAVGNHEFDEGLGELQRLQRGGCHPSDGCQDGDPFAGAQYRYLAANVFRRGVPVLPPYKVVDKLAFIGLTLDGTPNIVPPAGIAGLEFRPEVRTVNRLVKRLGERHGIRAFVVLLHEGGQQNAPYAEGVMDVNRCDNFSGDLEPIVRGLDDAVDVVVSAHTHVPYICNMAGKLVTSAASFGRLVTDIDLTLDRRSGDVASVVARNVVVARDVPKAPAQTALIAKYAELAAPVGDRVVGSAAADITRADTAAGETPLGDVIADAFLAATSKKDFGGAQVAFINPGGIRADLSAGEVTFADLFKILPFGANLTVKTLTGAQLYRLLEQQFDNPSRGQEQMLQVSEGFTYSYDRGGAPGERVVPGSVKIAGVAVEPGASYRVAMNSLLSAGADQFREFAQGTDVLDGSLDVDAVVAYFAEHSPVAPGPGNRITRLG